MASRRILAITTSYPKHPTDSTAPFVRNISHGLVNDGWSVDLVLPCHPELAWSGSDGPVSVHPYRYVPAALRGLHLWGYAGALRSDTALRSLVLPIVPAALTTAHRKLSQLTRRLRPDVLHAHWLVPNGVVAALVARRTGIPLVISLHGSDVYMAERYSVVGRLARWALHEAHCTTACSSDLASRARALAGGSLNLRRIPYGVDSAAFRPPSEEERAEARRRLEVGPETVVVLAVGRLVEKKGFEYLVAALARIPATSRLELLVVGDGHLRGSLERLARKQGVEGRVRFLGSASRDRLTDMFRAADILGVPSVRDSAGNVDGLPNVVLEGMGCGIPILTTSAGGIGDVIRNGENGIQVPERDAAALAQALVLLERDPELRRRLGASVRADVERALDWRHVTARYGEVLEEAARTHGE